HLSPDGLFENIDFPKLPSRKHIQDYHIHQWMEDMEKKYPVFLRHQNRAPFYFTQVLQTIAKSASFVPALKISLLQSHKIWSSEWFKKTENVLPHFSPPDLSRAVHSVSKLNVRPPRSWMKSLFRMSHRSFELFTPQDLSQMIHGMAKLHVVPPSYW